MNKSNKKSKSPLIFFVIVFVIIMVVMFLANYRKVSVPEIDVPGGAIASLYTIQNELIAISPGGAVYIWPWDNLQKKNKAGTIDEQAESTNILFVPPDSIIWASVKSPDTIIVKNLEDSRKLAKLTLPFGWQCKYLTLNNDATVIAAAIVKEPYTADVSDSWKNIQLNLLDIKTEEIILIAEFGGDNDVFVIADLAVSSDGKLIAVTGKKNDIGWIAVVNTEEKSILWQKTFEKSEDLNAVAFSVDGKEVYTGWIHRCIHSFKAVDGEFKYKWQMDKLTSSGQQERKQLMCISTSSDGRFVAAGSQVSGRAWLWKVDSRKPSQIFATGNLHMSGLAFSPDSKFLVTTAFEFTSKTRIWDVSEY